MNIDLQEILTEAWTTFSKTENLVPLVVGAVIVLFGGGLTFGVLAGPLMISYVRMCRRALDGEALEIGQISEGFSRFAGSFVLFLLLALASIVTLCTFVGPLVISFVAMFSFHVMAFDDEISGVDAIKRSFELVKANMGPCLLVFLIGVVIYSVLSGTFFLGFPAFGFAILMNTILFLRLDAAPTTVAAQPA